MDTRIMAHLKDDGAEGQIKFLKGFKHSDRTQKLDLLADWMALLKVQYDKIQQEEA